MTAGRGRFITVEGGDGAGKTTQVRLLAEDLRALGLRVMLTREPGGTPGAERIRELLVRGPVEGWDPVTEALLHFAARRDHLVRSVWPVLDRGDWVISDRFADSTMAYQGYGQGLERQAIDRLYGIAVGHFKPDLTLILDVPAEKALDRARARQGDAAALGTQAAGEDRYERLDQSFHERLRQGFLNIARIDPKRCAVVDAQGDVATVRSRIRAVVAQRLGLALA
ncbi:MAG TPA: dTMP kinase [Alphaproteobacteria bacterium]|nr:dTMP kinase [Alphaproteobacteria bacterium]